MATLTLERGAEARVKPAGVRVFGMNSMFSNGAHTETATGFIKYPYEKVIGCDEVVGCDVSRVKS